MEPFHEYSILTFVKHIIIEVVVVVECTGHRLHDKGQSISSISLGLIGPEPQLAQLALTAR